MTQVQACVDVCLVVFMLFLYTLYSTILIFIFLVRYLSDLCSWGKVLDSAFTIFTLSSPYYSLCQYNLWIQVFFASTTQYRTRTHRLLNKIFLLFKVLKDFQAQILMTISFQYTPECFCMCTQNFDYFDRSLKQHIVRKHVPFSRYLHTKNL